MGSRIAARLLNAGLELVIWNRTPGKAQPLAALGASVAATPAEAARPAEAVITMVSDSEALREVIEEPRDSPPAPPTRQRSSRCPLSGLPRSSLWRRVPGRHVAARRAGLGERGRGRVGNVDDLRRRPDPVVERWRQLLSTLGSVVHVGALGAGSSAKLVANSSLFGTLGVLGEALALAQSLGLSQQTAFKVLAATPLGAQAERRRPSIESDEYAARFPLSLARKDSDLILEAAGGLRSRPAAGRCRSNLARRGRPRPRGRGRHGRPRPNPSRVSHDPTTLPRGLPVPDCLLRRSAWCQPIREPVKSQSTTKPASASIRRSAPKPMSATDPAATPAAIATAKSAKW